MGEYSKVETLKGDFSIYIDDRCAAPAVVALRKRWREQGDRQPAVNWPSKGSSRYDLFWRQEPGLDLNEWSKADWKKGPPTTPTIPCGVSDVK